MTGGKLRQDGRLGGIHRAGLSYPMLTFLMLALALQTPGLTVTTFNIRYGTADDGADAWPHRRDLFMDVLRAQGADVIGLQEALRFQLDEIVAANPEYGQLGVGRENGDTVGEYAAILYRKDRFLVTATGTFWLSPTPGVPGSVGFGNTLTRICTWARFVERATGHGFYVFNVHLDHQSQPSRERAVALVVERIRTRAEADPVLLIGDFNVGPTNPARRLPTDSLGLRDAFLTLHPSERDVGTYHAFRGDRSGETIDAVMVGPGWTIISAAIDHTVRDGHYPSDHFPVTARLAWPR